MSDRSKRGSFGRRLSGLGALLGFFAVAVAVASCASSEDEPTPGDDIDSSSPIPAVDAAIDAGGDACDPDAEDCTTPRPPSCDDVEWCLEKTSHPAGIGLASVWGSGPNDVWAVGAHGTVTHWDGKQWTTAKVDTDWSLHTVWGCGPNDVWTMSAPNQIFHTTGFANGTATWTPMTPVTDEPIEPPALVGAIWGTSSTDVWVGGKILYMQREGNVFGEVAWRSAVTDDGAMAWAPGLQDWTFDMVRGIWGTGTGDVWMVGSKSDNLPFGAHSKGVAAAGGGVPQWRELDTQSLAGLNAVWGSGPNDVWAVGDNGTIRHTGAGATIWSIVESPTKANLRGIWGAAPNDVWAVGEQGTLLHYDGTDWTAVTGGFVPGTKPHLYGVWGSGPNDVWAVGSGIILHYSGPKPGAEGAKR